MRANFDSLEGVVRKGIVASVALTGGTLLSGPVLAATAEGEAKLPQLDIQTYPSQIFWLIVSFIVLYFLVSKIAVPRISDVLEERQERIADDLDKAETLNREAQDAVAKSGAEAEAEAQGNVAAMLKDAEVRIAAARTEAIGNVRSVARDVAGDAVTKLIGVTVAADEVDRVIDAAMEGRG
jgi:F-type H+-transporting ATPase subunit b